MNIIRGTICGWKIPLSIYQNNKKIIKMQNPSITSMLESVDADDGNIDIYSFGSVIGIKNIPVKKNSMLFIEQKTLFNVIDVSFLILLILYFVCTVCTSINDYILNVILLNICGIFIVSIIYRAISSKYLKISIH
jgi:hypothetical protein